MKKSISVSVSHSHPGIKYHLLPDIVPSNSIVRHCFGQFPSFILPMDYNKISIQPHLLLTIRSIIVIFCTNHKNILSRTIGKNNTNIMLRPELKYRVFHNKTNCYQMTQKSPRETANCGSLDLQRPSQRQNTNHNKQLIFQISNK